MQGTGWIWAFQFTSKALSNLLQWQIQETRSLWQEWSLMQEVSEEGKNNMSRKTRRVLGKEENLVHLELGFGCSTAILPFSQGLSWRRVQKKES